MHGTTAAVKKFISEDKPPNESSAHRFSDLNKKELQQAKYDERNQRNKLAFYHMGDLCFWES